MKPSPYPRASPTAPTEGWIPASASRSVRDYLANGVSGGFH